MADDSSRRYLLVAIDRATRWVYLEVVNHKSAANARAFLERLITKAPFRINKILTDNGKVFTDRFCATGERKPTGKHLFARLRQREYKAPLAQTSETSDHRYG